MAEIITAIIKSGCLNLSADEVNYRELNEGEIISKILKSGNKNNPYIEKWGSMDYIGTPTFRYTGYFCYLTLLKRYNLAAILPLEVIEPTQDAKLNFLVIRKYWSFDETLV